MCGGLKQPQSSACRSCYLARIAVHGRPKKISGVARSVMIVEVSWDRNGFRI